MIAYTGDTAWTDAIAAAAQSADLLIVEAYYRDKDIPYHLRLADLDARSDQIRARRVIITHMSDDMLGHTSTRHPSRPPATGPSSAYEAWGRPPRPRMSRPEGSRSMPAIAAVPRGGHAAEREQVIDALYREVEQLAGRALLLQAPVASDLRFLLSVLRVVPELERSHDLVMQIASQAGRPLAGGLSPGARGLAERMGGLAAGMWCQAADAWYARDRCAASALDDRDAEMGQLHASLAAELASGRMAIPVTMEMTLVARCYERLGAHAVNIARRVAYLAGPTAS